MSYLDSDWISKIQRPSRYIGEELHSIRKDLLGTEVSMVMAFPDVYEVGMSHVGLKILYHILNREPWLAAERVFCPWIDLEDKLRQTGEKLISLESGRPLKDFDIVGFSLQHELCFTNVLTMLELGGIPLFRSQRRRSDPLVIAGGPTCFNPEPVADFFDLFLVGDGEEAALEICRVIRENKHLKENDRGHLLRILSSIQGVYVPGFFDVDYDDEGRVTAIQPLVDGYSSVRKAVVPDLDLFPFPASQVIPFTQLVHDRLSIEIARGCTRGCRFCQAGMIYRPVRERSMESILKSAAKAIERSGYDEISLLSLSAGDYSCIEPLLKTLMDNYARKKVALSLPSLRVDTVSPFFMDQIKRVRKTGFTLAVEAGSDRLRRIINKGLTRGEIISMAGKIYGAGWNLIKLYFMVGLPLETEEDIRDIVRLAKEIIRAAPRHGEHLNVSVSSFVPKAHTPFMWAAQADTGEAQEKISLIKQGLWKTRVKVKGNPTDQGWLEGIFSRGDRRLGKVVHEAWRRGARFDGWGELFRKRIWEDSLASVGLDPAFYLKRERNQDEIFPWDHIESGVTKEFLWDEWQKAIQEALTPDCRKGCGGCGVCDFDGIAPVIAGNSPALETDFIGAEKDAQEGQVYLYRLGFSKAGRARLLGHLEMLQFFLRAFRRALLPLAYSQGFHPMPRISFAQALPLGTESLDESLDMRLTSPLEPEDLMVRVNRELEGVMLITSVTRISSADDRRGFVRKSRFSLTLQDGEFLNECLEEFNSAESFPVNKPTGAIIKTVDAKSMVSKISIISQRVVELELRYSSGPQLKPSDIVKAIFRINDSSVEAMHIVKTRQILGPPPDNKQKGEETEDVQ